MKSSRQPRLALFRPVVSGWQKWEQDEAGAWAMSGEALEMSELKPEAGALVAIPVRRAFSLAVWVPADDPSLFGDLVYTQLELRGLAGRSRETTSFAWQEITREGNEALLHAVVLPSNLAPQYWHGEVTAYAVSPSCLPLAPDSVSLWQEEGGWVAAVTRGDRLLHFQQMNEQTPSPAMALEVWLMLAPLDAGRMLSGGGRVTVYYQDNDAPDLSAWAASGFDAKAEKFPAPVRPAQPLGCVPLPVQETQRVKETSARRQKIALFAAAAYFVLVLALAANTLWLWWRADSLRRTIDSEQPDVEAVRSAMQRWNAIEPALNPPGYPLEVLYQTARLLPKDGVRLTLFQMNLDKVMLAGEASTLQAAQRFQEDVRKNPELAGYDWTMENPRPLPTGSARFQIDGVRHGAATSTGEEEIDESADG
ncbi:MAG: hypothetical protein ACO3RX_00305 [Chthoniobacterales bacterium]